MNIPAYISGTAGSITDNEACCPIKKTCNDDRLNNTTEMLSKTQQLLGMKLIEDFGDLPLLQQQ